MTRDGVTWGVASVRSNARASITALATSFGRRRASLMSSRTSRLRGSSLGSAAVPTTQVHLGLTSPTVEGAAPTATATVEGAAALLREAVKMNAQALAAMFRASSEDWDGMAFTKSEFRKAIPLIGVKASRAEIDALFDEIDADKGGSS